MFRYGWYIPHRTVAGSSDMRNHWRILKQKEKMSIFEPTPAQYGYVEKMALKSDIR